MTETDGRQILTGLAETRKFFQQVSLLMQTMEDSFRTKGWDNLFRNRCSDIANNLYEPKNWMPIKIYRFFVAGEDSDENKDLVVFVGILLDGASSWGGFREPWFTCGLYRFKTEIDVRKFINWGWVSEHLDFEMDPDGAFHDHELTDEDGEENNLVYETTMAMPLVGIDNAQALKKKVIDPLLQQISEMADTDDAKG